MKTSEFMDLFPTNTTKLSAPQDAKRRTGIVWITIIFISCLDSHSDGTHSLQRIHCWMNYSFKVQHHSMSHWRKVLSTLKMSCPFSMFFSSQARNMRVCSGPGYIKNCLPKYIPVGHTEAFLLGCWSCSGSVEKQSVSILESYKQ